MLEAIAHTVLIVFLAIAAGIVLFLAELASLASLAERSRGYSDDG